MCICALSLLLSFILCLTPNSFGYHFVNKHLTRINAPRTFYYVRSLISKSGKDKYIKLYIFRKPTITGIYYMKMKSNDLFKLMILIFVSILTYLIAPYYFIRREAF